MLGNKAHGRIQKIARILQTVQDLHNEGVKDDIAKPQQNHCADNRPQHTADPAFERRSGTVENRCHISPLQIFAAFGNDDPHRAENNPDQQAIDP